MNEKEQSKTNASADNKAAEEKAAQVAAEAKAAKDALSKREAGSAINRAVAHLLDYASRLDKDGYLAMANEVRGTADGLSLPTGLLGIPVAYKVTVNVERS